MRTTIPWRTRDGPSYGRPRATRLEPPRDWPHTCVGNAWNWLALSRSLRYIFFIVSSSETQRRRPHGAIFVHGKELEQLGYPPTIPLNTRRAAMVRDLAVQLGLLGTPDRLQVPPRLATREELERFHHPRYLDLLQRAELGEFSDEHLAAGLGTLDCPIFDAVYRYPSWASGATLTAAEYLVQGRAGVAFNPSGGYHHAMPARAAGFCYLNDVVLGALRLVDAGWRVLVLDVDAHHSDGVQLAFYDRRDVMVISVHETGRVLFPGTGFEDEIGAGDGRGYTVNVPLPPGTTDRQYLRVLREVVWPLVDAFDADVFVVELGMDTLAGDPLTHMQLTNNTGAEVVIELLARDRPILALGGGGYNVPNTVRGWTLCWSILCGANDGLSDYGVGAGGVLLQNTDWLGGLRDPVGMDAFGEVEDLDREVDDVIAKIQALVFPLHGL